MIAHVQAPSLIYEDNHLLALDKPAGWLVQADRTGDATLTDWGKTWLKERYDKPGAVFLHPVHRIDRPVSGAVLLARTDKALSRLTEAFRGRDVHKTYWALVLKRPRLDADTLRHWLVKDERRNTVEAFSQPASQGKESILDYRLIDRVGAYFLLEVNPVTGRSHQIRAQLSAIGCAIVGDLKYGALAPLPDASIALWCKKMTLIHPVRKTPLVIESICRPNWLGN